MNLPTAILLTGQDEWDRWKKIGEVDHPTGFFTAGIYSTYAVMERINRITGMRQYKEVFMASASDHISLTSQPS